MNSEQFVRVCECGCGQPTRVSPCTDARYGHVKGQPYRHLSTHRRHVACSADGCEKQATCRGLCQQHYCRQRRHGDLLGRYPREGAATRFWMRVDKGSDGGCWLWTAGLSSTGYGSFKDDGGRSVSAHRFSYELHRGPIAEGMHVLHSCDTPACVNPSHLSLGTRKDNMRDMLDKGRGRPGGRQFSPKGAA